MMLPMISKESRFGDANYKAPKSFPIGPFTKYENNPILRPNPDNDFESAYLYNATAIVVDDKVYLLYRAQNEAKLSSVGLAWSEDGVNFTRYSIPILTATEPWEQGGGIEDPRIVRDPVSKLFIVTYTAYDLHHARLCVATSEDLFHWKKYPSFIPEDWHDIAYNGNGDPHVRKQWSKSGAIFTEKAPDGKYYMIWGDSSLYLAESDDLVNWSVLDKDFTKATFADRKLKFESRLIESGPAPIKLDNGKNQWIFVYNASTTGSEDLPPNSYTISEMLIDYDNIKAGPIARLETPILKPESDNEKEGQVNKVVFCEGMVQFKGKWFLYFGQADSELGVAFAPVE
ncbi:glycosyl hydrolase [Scheffersomyces xylosifermentans]|uniref:glycosyl hydrolase n=1 Tax=Scheffersomyces xylosifermentans TaxID=1304137 RepID=UPI00315DCAE0